MLHRLLLIGCLLLPTHTWAAPSIDVQLSEMDQAMLVAGASDRIDTLVEAYSSWASSMPAGSHCQDLDDLTLEAAFHASFRLSSYIGDEEWLDRVRCLHAALRQRGLATATIHTKMHALLVQVRRFTEANELREAEQLGVNVLPGIERNTPGRQGTLQRLSDGKLEWRRWTYRRGSEVVAYVSPACAPSRRAMHAIMHDPEWQWIRSRIRFVVRRTPAWPQPGVDAWNRSNPSHPMLLQAGPEGWKELDVYETPVFHVLRNGQRLRTVVGWAQDGADLMRLKDGF